MAQRKRSILNPLSWFQGTDTSLEEKGFSKEGLREES